MSKRFTTVILAALVMLILLGCSKPPEQEMQMASSAFDAAKAVEAELYAPEAYRAAMDTLNTAQAMKTEQDGKFALFRGYGKSKEMFVNAEAMANQAKTEAEAEKERVKMLVTDLLAQAKTSLDATTAAFSKAPRGKGARADLELIKSDLDAIVASYDAATADFNNGKYLAAKSKLEVIMNKAAQLQEEISMAGKKKTP
ncbi:MAG: hypothetical protein ABH878_09560 [bacterium]